MKPKSLKDELQQILDFASLEQEVYLNVIRTAEVLAAKPNSLLREAGLSESQYNVLRILRGAARHRGHGCGLPCREIIHRMVTRDSDMTRLLDGLEKKGLVERERSAQDRRVVEAKILKAGLTLLQSLEKPLLATHKASLGHLNKEQLKTLSQLLDSARHQDNSN